MEDYAEELRTPPVALVSLVGVPELHQTISSFLHSEQPPINTLALPDFSKISVLARKARGASDAGRPAGGILKREWVKKHRTRVPAVVVALFGADRVNGDPAQWLQVCTDLDNVKAIVRGRNIKLAVVLVQTTIRDDINEDLITALRKRAEIDAKYLTTFIQNDSVEQRKSLHRLAGMLAELSNIYYREEGRRIKTRIEKKNFGSIELHIRYCFKVAVFAEFRRDWTEALRFYDEAYHTLHEEMIGAPTKLPPIQQLVEIKTVAEQLHFKVSTLLLHGGKVVEAITWFHKHISSAGQLMAPMEVAFLNWEWLSRQYLVFAELLETSSAAVPSSVSLHSGASDFSLTEWELQPAYYYQLSACYLEKKRYSLEQSLSLRESSELTDASDSTLESVSPSIFVGQYGRSLDQGDTFSMTPLSDGEYTCYALAEGKRYQDSFEIIALFRKAFESFNTLKAPRMASFCGHKMAKEHFASGEFGKAKQVFDGIASIYRQECWVTLLWENLGYLRECSRKLGLQKEFIEYSLEMAALPIFSNGMTITPVDGDGYGPAGVASLSQREIIQEEVFRFLKGENVSTNDSNFVRTISVDHLIHLEVDPVSPLRAVFLACVAFHDQVVKPGISTLLTLSLLSRLPHPVEISELDVQFNQPACNFTITGGQKMPSAAKFVRVEDDSLVENAHVLILTTRRWLRLTYEIPSGQSGKLECLSVTAKLGPHCTICCRAESPASMEELPLWKFDQPQNFPTKDPALSFSGQKIIQVEEPEPLVDLNLNAVGPALVGEIFTIPVSVISKGHAIHSGELKINLVDARGGGLMSPRDVEAFSPDSHHVELLSVSGITENDELQETDKIRRIQHSFGLVSVPTLAIDETWSCKLEIKWHRPKPIMLYVSLGYCPTDTEVASQRVNVHRSLQIEGKTPVTISHQFMLPFRCEPLLLSKIKQQPEADQTLSLALKETNILIVSCKNCSEVPLQLMSLSIEPGSNEIVLHSAQQSGRSSTDYPVIVPGEEFKQVFSVVPQCDSSKLVIGCVCLNVRRKMDPNGVPNSGFLVKQKLPDVKVEKPPLLVHIECPPYAVLGVPFTCYVRVQNQTSFLQEIKYSLSDSQSFVFSGPHNNTVSILPKSDCIINYMVVPLGSGMQQLPLLTVMSVRYSAELHPSVAASTVFVFPSQPHFDVEGLQT